MIKYTQLIKESRGFFIDAAIDLARFSVEKGGGPFGCVIVKNNRIVGRGHNRVTLNNDPTAHAEIMAIRDACKNLGTFQLTGCEVYTSCYPCPMCLGAIYWARPSIIYYGASRHDADDFGFDDKFIYDEFSKPDEERKIPTVQISGLEAVDVFKKNWGNKTDKIEY
jgi:guanine deaminase